MWKQIENLDYEINSEGIVRRISTGRVKKSFLRKDGYIGIQLYSDKPINYQLHRLIGIYFIDNPNNHPFINHKDSIRANNALDNLEWVDARENIIHGHKFGKITTKGSKNGFSKLNEEQVLEIRKLHKGGQTYQSLANLYNLSYGNIATICKRNSWKHI